MHRYLLYIFFIFYIFEIFFNIYNFFLNNLGKGGLEENLWYHRQVSSWILPVPLMHPWVLNVRRGLRSPWDWKRLSRASISQLTEILNKKMHPEIEFLPMSSVSFCFLMENLHYMYLKIQIRFLLIGLL